MVRTRFAAWGAAISLLPVVALAQNQGSLEERLRTQLRTLNAQNQQLQAEKASVQSALRTAESERDAARKELAATQGELDTSRQRSQGLAARQRKVEEAAAAQARQADEKREASQQLARTLEQQLATTTQERAKLADGLRERDAHLQSCSAMNARLLATGREILDVYEHFDVADALGYHQPFAGGMRVRLENEAQAFGDKLYENKFDPRAATGAPKLSQ